MDKENVEYTGILFSHKKDEVPTHAIMWTNLEAIMLSEGRQTQKDAEFCASLYTIHELKVTSMGCRDRTAWASRVLVMLLFPHQGETLQKLTALYTYVICALFCTYTAKHLFLKM